MRAARCSIFAASCALTIKYKIAKQMTKLWDRAGVAPKYQAIGLNRHYDTITIPDDVLDALPDEE